MSWQGLETEQPDADNSPTSPHALTASGLKICKFADKCYSKRCRFAHPTSEGVYRVGAAGIPPGPPGLRSPPGLRPCKYGARCYNQDKEHRRRFRHPDDEPTIPDSENLSMLPEPMIIDQRDLATSSLGRHQVLTLTNPPCQQLGVDADFDTTMRTPPGFLPSAGVVEAREAGGLPGVKQRVVGGVSASKAFRTADQVQFGDMIPPSPHGYAIPWYQPNLSCMMTLCGCGFCPLRTLIDSVAPVDCTWFVMTKGGAVAWAFLLWLTTLYVFLFGVLLWWGELSVAYYVLFVIFPMMFCVFLLGVKKKLHVAEHTVTTIMKGIFCAPCIVGQFVATAEAKSSSAREWLLDEGSHVQVQVA